ncbi:amino acid ABC transporter permease [Rhodococcus sp. WS3]|uniref:amino acid ABC transporter permease n=2 Tax=Rhodococcus TaxID=1827 RepID=UPI0009FF6BF2|nr:amino acid ABC transporter permease [Rhodococcus sp. AD45]ROZ42915.1 amino acid ABC transporter permease [Rhodococcus sp. WS3]RZL20794.1 MAG: amino acid ABC transporter permease [Rhodococcus sp. (in: high G+C Gram-positive bacteria)]
MKTLPHAQTAVGIFHARSRPRPLQWIAAAIMGGLAAAVVVSLATNPAYQWDVVATYFWSDKVISGLGLTLLLSALAMTIGILLGIVIAVMRRSRNKLLSIIGTAYVALFRGTPLLVQLILWFNLAALYPVIRLGIPFGPSVSSWDTNQLITPILAAVLALGLNEAAYMSEIVRGGIESVDEGQPEAATALGMSGRKTFMRIVLPQALRVIIPPTGNQVIGMLKMTSIVSVIGTSELLYSVQTIYTRTYQVIPLLIVASIWYFIMTTILTYLQGLLERRISGKATKTRKTRAISMNRLKMRKTPAISMSHLKTRRAKP